MVTRVKIGGREFQIGKKTYVMGILNVTPDSFSDGGRWKEPDQALFHVEEMLKDGMDILDIGGESTRPGYTMLSEEEEITRVVPMIEAVKSRFDIPVSLDTYKSRVAKAGLEAGVDLINDIWGLKYDPQMARVIGESGVSCCLTHNRKEPGDRNFVQEVIQDLEESLRLAEQGGIMRDKIILDPGVGFGKTYEQNLQTVNKLEIFHSLGCPLLLGASRKSLIGLTLDLPVTERLEGTLVTTVMAVIKGCSFVRVHDIKENIRAIQMAEAILYHE